MNPRCRRLELMCVVEKFYSSAVSYFTKKKNRPSLRGIDLHLLDRDWTGRSPYSTSAQPPIYMLFLVVIATEIVIWRKGCYGLRGHILILIDGPKELNCTALAGNILILIEGPNDSGSAIKFETFSQFNVCTYPLYITILYRNLPPCFIHTYSLHVWFRCRSGRPYQAVQKYVVLTLMSEVGRFCPCAHRLLSAPFTQSRPSATKTSRRQKDAPWRIDYATSCLGTQWVNRSSNVSYMIHPPPYLTRLDMENLP